MKKVAIGQKIICWLFVLLLMLSASACVADKPESSQSSASDDSPYNLHTVDVFLKNEDELLDFLASTDENYPVGDERLSGSIADLLRFIRQDGYIWMMRDPERQLQSEAWRIHGDPQSGRQVISYCLGPAEQRITVMQEYPNAALRGKTLSAWMDANPGWPTPASWESNDLLTSCKNTEYVINGEKTEAIIMRGVIEEQYHFYEIRAMLGGMLIGVSEFEEDGCETVPQYVWEKVPLPDAEEARARVEQREKAAKEAEEAYKTAQAEALLGPPKAESFPLSREELLAFLNTVDAAAYPAAGDRGEGKLLPLITQIREEAYVWLPSVDGVPAEPKAGYYTVKSLGTHSLPEYSVEGFLAGDPSQVYNLYVTYPGEEARVLLEKSVEAFRQGQGGQTVTAENWKGKEYIADYREAEFMLNGEKLTGVTMTGVLSSDPDHWRTHLWFYYDGKLMELNTYEAPEPSFDLSMFEGLTLKKIPLN